MSDPSHLRCACGDVRLEVHRAPIVSAECHCTSCRTAGMRLQALPDAPPLVEANGGTRMVLYRKDRVRIVAGQDRLLAFRLRPASKTRRVVADCCNTPMFLEFQNGHWLSLYARLWPPGAQPRIELRTMTSDLADPSLLPDDVPNMPRQSGRFFARLLGAWVAMGFRAPKIEVGRELPV